MFLLSGLSGAFVRLFRVPESDRGVCLFEILCGNTAYMGIPVCIAVPGKSSAFYTSLLNIPYELICFSFGIFLLSGKFSFKRILNPPFLAALCGMILHLLRVPVPDVLVDGCAFIGQATSSCAMLIIGSASAEVPLRELFDDWRIIPYLFLRLAGLGVLMLVLLKPFLIDPVLHGVLVLMASMPAATNSTMLCHIYGGNRFLSAKLIFLSTAFSAVTIPIWSGNLLPVTAPSANRQDSAQIHSFSVSGLSGPFFVFVYKLRSGTVSLIFSELPPFAAVSISRRLSRPQFLPAAAALCHGMHGRIPERIPGRSLSGHAPHGQLSAAGSCFPSLQSSSRKRTVMTVPSPSLLFTSMEA